MGSIWSLFGGCPGEKGDLLIFTNCNDHNHYAVNVGEGYIIHTTPILSDGQEFSADSGTCCRGLAKIKKEKYSDFIKQGDKSCKVRVENSMTSKDEERLATEIVVATAKYGVSACLKRILPNILFPFPFYKRNSLDLEDKETLSIKEIVKRANSRIDMNDYSSSLNNCKSFALWCRYGKKNRDPAEIESDIDTIVKSVHLGIGQQGFSEGVHPDDRKSHIERIVRSIQNIISVASFPQLSEVRVPLDMGLQEARYQADNIGKAGDLLRLRRCGGLYEHYAVNVGYGYLVHANPVSDEQLCSADLGCSSHRSSIAIIKLEYYSEVVKTTDEVEVENSMTWNGKERLPTEEIVKRALSQIGERGYSLMWNNCEHFARSCRYADKTSTQVVSLIIAILVVFIAVALCCFLG